MSKYANKISVPKVEYRKGVFYLVLDGKTPHERGIQHGTALSYPINKTLQQFKHWLKNVVKIEDPSSMIHEFVNDTPFMKALEQDFPEILSEMQGIAGGSNADLNELFLYQSFDELIQFLHASGSLDSGDLSHCTTVGVYGRTKLPNMVGHNNDIAPYHERATTVLHIKCPDSGLEILQSTFAGQISQNGVNNKGVAVGINFIMDLPLGNGVPVSFYSRKILETGSVDEAVRLLKRARFGQAMNYMIGDREKVVCVEAWEDKAAVVNVFDGSFLVHTNHTLREGVRRTIEINEELGGGSITNTQERFDLALKLISTSYMDITLEDFKAIFKQRPILVHPGKPSGRTIMNMVTEIPKKGSPILHLTPDSPNICDHAVFTF